MSEPFIPVSPEHSNPPQGITFEVDKPELIYKAIEEGQSGTLAEKLLEYPITGTEIAVQSDGNTFDLTCTVDLDMKATMPGLGRKPKNERMDYFIDDDQPAPPPEIRYDAVIDQLVERLSQQGQVIERGGNYIFQGQRGTNLVLAKAGILEKLTISTGKVKSFILDAKEVLPSPEVNEESFTNALGDSVDALGLLIDTVYSLVGKQAPAERVEIKPPRLKLGRGKSSLTPEELVDKIEVERPKVTFDDIGGQEQAKREIEGLAFALSNPELYEKWGTKPPKGILLYGPPGTGKTLMAKALAAQAKARFFHVKASDIGSKWYGESEQIVQQIFDAAGDNGKTIIFFDEIDSIVPNREGAHEATQKVIGTLLQNIDGMESNDNVMVVASTNRLQSIDSAMLRPGRLDRLVEVGLPDKEGREQILGIHLSKANEIAGRELTESIDMERIASQTDGLSGADIAEIVRRALEEKVRQEGSGIDPGLLTTQDLLQEITNYERIAKTKQDQSGAYL